MNTGRTRRYAQFTAAALLAVAITGCSSGQDPSASNGQVSLTMLSWSNPQVLKAYPQTLDPFTAKTGIKVAVQSTGSTSYEDVAQKLANSLTAGNPPDIAAVGTNDVPRFAANNVAQSLDTLMAADKEFVTTNYDPSLLDAGKVDSRQYGIPYSVSTMTLLYNKDAFRKAGLDPDRPPQSFSELKAAAQALVTSKAAKIGTNYNLDTSANWNFQNYLFSAGGSMMDRENSSVSFDSQKGVDVLTYWRDLVSSGLAVAGKESDAVDAFTRGELGMFIGSSAQLTNVAPVAKFTLGAAPYPIPDGGTRAVPPGGSSLIVVTKDPARQAAAWQVIRTLTGPEGSTALTKNSGYTPVSKLAVAGQQYLAPLLAREPLRQVSIQQTRHLVPWFQFPGPNAVEISESLGDEITAALRGDKNPADALKSAASTADGLLP